MTKHHRDFYMYVSDCIAGEWVKNMNMSTIASPASA